MKIKTIARNRTKLINQIFEEATFAQAFRLDDGFRGVEVCKYFIKKELLEISFAKLTTDIDNPGTFTVQIHSNLWYEIKSPVRLS